MGIPLERLIGDAKELLELGNDTVSYNLHDFVNIYLKGSSCISVGKI